jgi:hypothetical protein
MHKYREKKEQYLNAQLTLYEERGDSAEEAALQYYSSMVDYFRSL